MDPVQPPLFSLKIVSIDHIMTPAMPSIDACFSPFSGTASTDIQVPVVRIFGSTSCGQTCCLHLHRLFPYFYVSYPSCFPTEASEAAINLKKMAIGLETAMQAISMAKKASGTGTRQSFVQNLQVVKAKNMYGFHPSDELFIKVSLFRPGDVERAASVLCSGSVLSLRFSPAFEAHVPFILQVMMDLNLRGMGEIELRSVLFRDPLPASGSCHRPGWRRRRKEASIEVQYQDEAQPSPSPSSSPISSLPIHSSNCPSGVKWSSSSHHRNAPKRQAPGCDLEADACAEDVINRSKVRTSPPSWPLESRHSYLRRLLSRPFECLLTKPAQRCSCWTASSQCGRRRGRDVKEGPFLHDPSRPLVILLGGLSFRQWWRAWSRG